MLANSQRVLIATLTIFAACASSATAQVTALAVDLSGDVKGAGNQNSSLDAGGQVQTSIGDFDGDGNADDSRFFIPMDHGGNFVNVTTDGTDGPNKSGTWASGVELLGFDTTDTPSVLGVYRYETGSDRLQAGTNNDGTPAAASQSFAFAPHVRKSNFLNGASGAETASFSNDPNGFFIDWSFQNTPSTRGDRRVRATVQNGDDWYVTGWASGSSNSDRTFNPATEEWFPYDPATTLFVDEVGGGDTDPVGGGGVLGSTFTDIQAIGSLHYMYDFSQGAAPPAINFPVFNLFGLTASLDFTLPPPPTAPTGRALVEWGMNSVETGVSLTDPFSVGSVEGEFQWNGSAVPDDSYTASDPLFFGDPIQPPTRPDAFFDTANAPELTTGGQGVIGEALRFNGNEEDEAIGIVAWQGDPTDSFVDEPLDSVYVSFHFKEDDNTDGTQVLVRGRSTFEVRINSLGQLEWVTGLEAGGSNIITSDPLGTEGAWRHVEAWHDEEGNKALFLDGVLVGTASPGALRNDTNSIILGNEENDERWYSGLIDEVFVGTGVPLDGDYSGDELVTSVDYAVWRSFAGDSADYDTWLANFNGPGGSPAQAISAVPEPSALALVGLSLLGVARLRRNENE